MKPFDGPHSQRFPYVVIRWMACAYDVRPIEVDRSADPATMRREVLERCHQIVEKSGRRCCAVFAPNDAVFCEPGRIEIARDEPPSGGVAVGPLALEPTPQRRN